MTEKTTLAAKSPLEYIAEKLDEAESTANDLFLDLIQGKVVSADGANILLTVRALCLNAMHFSAQNIRAALEAKPDESLKALEAAVEAEYEKNRWTMPKSDHLSGWVDALSWVLKLIAEATKQEELKETRA